MFTSYQHIKALSTVFYILIGAASLIHEWIKYLQYCYYIFKFIASSFNSN